MTLNNDKNFWSEIGTWIVKAYKVVREPVCYLLVVITLIASILQNQKVLLTSLAILLGIVVRILFEDIAPVFKTRNGGYTRIIRLGQRQGDAGQLAIVEFVELPAAAAPAPAEATPAAATASA